jgi:hypothetical protein
MLYFVDAKTKRNAKTLSPVIGGIINIDNGALSI